MAQFIELQAQVFLLLAESPVIAGEDNIRLLPGRALITSSPFGSRLVAPNVVHIVGPNMNYEDSRLALRS
jgi:hypothetical protein